MKKHHSAVGQAFGKLILIGEHAVVHGYPAIGMPFHLLDVTAQTTFVPGPTVIDCNFYRGSLVKAPHFLHGLKDVMTKLLTKVGHGGEGCFIRIASTIPPGRGLGSSAAVSAAVIRSMLSYFRHPYTHRDLLQLIHISEKHVHGTPSGIDSEAVLAQGPFWFVKGHPSEPLTTGRPVRLVVADSGQISDTRSSVASVHEQLRSIPKKALARLDSLGDWALSARKSLAKGDIFQLGNALNGAQFELKKLGVSSPVLNRLISAAEKAGALGAKLTGGGRGGCIISLARDVVHAEKLARTLLDAGAHKVWQFTVGGEKSE